MSLLILQFCRNLHLPARGLCELGSNLGIFINAELLLAVKAFRQSRKCCKCSSLLVLPVLVGSIPPTAALAASMREAGENQRYFYLESSGIQGCGINHTGFPFWSLHFVLVLICCIV